MLRNLKSLTLAAILTTIMQRTFLALTLFLSTLLTANAQTAKLSCSNFNGGAFYYYTPSDTIVVYRGLEYWISADVRGNTCIVSKIAWKDSANFVTHLNYVLDEDRNRFQDSSKIYFASTYYSVYSVDEKSITYKVRYSQNDTNSHFITLHTLYDSIAWQYLIYADSNLYKDTAEIKKLYGKPEEKYYCNMPYFINLQTDSSETQFVSFMISLFQKGDIKPAFEFAAPNLKAHSPAAVIDDYNQYVQHLFGKLQSYTVTSIKDGFHIKKNERAHNYIIHGTFEKLSGKANEADLCITTNSASINPLISVNVVVDSLSKIPFLNELSNGFWVLLKQKEYHKIYDLSALKMKEKIDYKQVEKIFKYVDSLGHIDDYKLFFQNFNTSGNRGQIVLSFKAGAPDKPLFMNLLYIFENGEYKLAGVNAPKK